MDAHANAHAPSSTLPHARFAENLGNVPIVYRPEYNIAFWHLESLHPFDSKKYEKVWRGLQQHEEKDVAAAAAAAAAPTAHERDHPKRPARSRLEPFVARQPTTDELLAVHTAEYLATLSSSGRVAQMIEVPPVACLPRQLVQRHVLDPMLYATGGSILAALLAVQLHEQMIASAAVAPPRPEWPPSRVDPRCRIGWSVNLGGGFHHASHDDGGGFCIYSDITLAIVQVHRALPHIRRFMIVDLDAHQGNGHERDKLSGVYDRLGNAHDDNDNSAIQVFIVDAFNSSIYPRDMVAARAIDEAVRVRSGTSDAEYLSAVRRSLDTAFARFHPQLVLYNAGTDVLRNDPLGHLDVSADGIVERDALVFDACHRARVPITMLLSGGYQKSNAAIIVRSLRDLCERFHLWSTVEAASSSSSSSSSTSPSSLPTTT